MPPEEQAEIDALIAADMAETLWRPMIDIENPQVPTPQRQAYDSTADVLLYGGSAGGGKSDLLLGLGLTEHTRSILFRREYKQLSALVDRAHEIRRTRDGYAAHPEHRFNLGDGRVMRMGGMQHPGDETDYQGQPHDFYGFDELTQFTERQFRYVITWNRSTKPKQRCRVIGASNPPETAEGEWIIRYWAPWLDDQHPNPALPGELRWFISDEEGKDREVEGPDGGVVIGGEYVTPRSRTFIPSSIDDNPFLLATGYKATLQQLPEPLRSQMLRGDFTAGREDNPWQVVPTAWVTAAQARWTPEQPRRPMSALGVDVAMGGSDNTVLIPRYSDWFGQPQVHPGKSTPDSRTTAGLIVGALRNGAPACIDVVGPGGEAYGHLDGQGVNVVAMHGGKPTDARDISGKIGFVNRRALWYWRMREALDPMAEHPISLPPDQTLKADLCAPRWKMTPRGIQVESKPDIIKRLGRSPDYGDAAVYALFDAPPKRRGEIVHEGVSGYNPHRP
ncbi:MAG: terminase family protein [Hyphomicrobiales bacterium]|nr:terminase family protein [Hyphomicrobiales bacterium]